MCKLCCIDHKGGCLAPGHNFAALLERQRGKCLASQLPPLSNDPHPRRPQSSPLILSTYNKHLSSPVDFTLDLDTPISAHDASVVLDNYVEKMMDSPFTQLIEAGKESALRAAADTAEEAHLEAQEELRIPSCASRVP